ncbi:MAG: (2Fe-2S)-binding protein [Promethearchaeota archaeon]
MDILFSVNGRKYILEVDPKESLMDILRERLNLTGTKNGCNTGHCGACTVIMNGEAVKSCTIKAKKIQNSDILTIEGISDGYHLHPIQEAFIKATAVQCGYCTPGIIMTLHALLAKNPNAPESEICSALEGHLCRCTGYKPILDAALLAQELLNR